MRLVLERDCGERNLLGLQPEVVEVLQAVLCAIRGLEDRTLHIVRVHIDALQIKLVVTVVRSGRDRSLDIRCLHNLAEGLGEGTVGIQDLVLRGLSALFAGHIADQGENGILCFLLLFDGLLCVLVEGLCDCDIDFRDTVVDRGLTLLFGISALKLLVLADGRRGDRVVLAFLPEARSLNGIRLVNPRLCVLRVRLRLNILQFAVVVIRVRHIHLDEHVFVCGERRNLFRRGGRTCLGRGSRAAVRSCRGLRLLTAAGSEQGCRSECRKDAIELFSHIQNPLL